MNINFVLIERRRFIETSFVAAELVVKISNLKFLINTIFWTTHNYSDNQTLCHDLTLLKK